MPPTRNIPPAKVVKTERTHEENQERAYIAASRRSDRSLEARVESARRASEIHKRRTGRSLRVTEQDVVNEEMYEEEDDDLPHPYRRLTAGLQTGSADFNRRLAAYLTNHVAMRSALDQAITSSYAQTYPNAPQFVHNQSMYQSPFITQPIPQQMPYYPATFRQAPPPYPTPGATSFIQHHPSRPVPNPQQRPVINPLHSVASPPPLEPGNSRAISMPVAPLTPSPSISSSTSNVHSPQTRPTPQQTSANLNMDYNHQMMMQQQHQMMQSPLAMSSSCEDYTSPYTMSLPPEMQMLLGNTLDPNDPLTSMMMAGSENFPSYYHYGSYLPDTKPQHTASYDGLTATLSPSALDYTPLDDYTTSLNPVPSHNFDDTFGAPAKVPPPTMNTGSMITSDGGGPVVEREWAAFIDNEWDQNPA